MIKINEACAILGLPEDDKGKTKAREVLNYFGVSTEEGPKPEGASFGKPSKLYHQPDVELIAKFKKESFPD